MRKSPRQWNESSNAPTPRFSDKDTMFRRLFERSHDPTWLLDPSTERLIDCNAAAMALMRADSRDRVLGMSLAQLSPGTQEDGRDSSETARMITQTALDQGGVRFEWMAKRLDGTLVPLEVGATAVDDGPRSLLVLVCRDVSERRRAEDSLREHRQLLASVTENLREAVYRSAPDHSLTFVNAAWLRLFGFGSLSEARGVPRERIYAEPSERTRILGLLKSNGGFTDEEVEFVRRDGSRFWGLMASRCVLEAGGTAVAYHVGSIVDITERRRVDAALRASEERFRRFFEESADAMALIDPVGGCFLDVNQALLFKLGYERKAQLIGVSAGALAPARQPDGSPSSAVASAIIMRALREGSIRTEWWVRRADGTEMPIEAVITALQLGERPLLLSISRDISERKRAEDSLRQLNVRLEDLVAERTAALQVSNQLLRDEIAQRQRREKVEHAVFRITEAIHQAADMDQLYPLLHEAVGELMPARNFYIALHDGATELHHFVYHRDEMDPPPAPRRLGRGLTAHVFRSGKPLLLNRAAMLGGVELSGEVWRVEHGTPSAIWLGAPLVAHGRILGVMAVQDYHNEKAFGDEEQRLLTFIAEQAALAIERKRAEQALRESEERHRALFEGSSQGVLLHDDRRIVAANTAVCRMLGFNRPEELVGRHPVETSASIQPSGESAEVLAARHIAAAFEKGQTRFEWVARRRDGFEFPIEVLLTTVQWGSNRIIQAVIDDIRERKRRERVERAHYRISECIHEAGDLGAMYPMIHRIVSELMPAENFFIALCDSTGSLLEFPYWRDVKDPPPPARRTPRGLTGIVLREGRSLLVTRQDFEESIPSPEGTRFDRLGVTAQIGSGTQPLVWLGVPLVFQGRTLGAMVLQSYENERAYGEEERRILGFIAEQTSLAIGRKRADDTFKQRHREMLALLNSLPGYAYFKDAAGRYAMANENFARAVGHTPESLVGRTDFEVFPADVAERSRSDDQRLVVSRNTVQVGEERMFEGGREFHVETTKVPVKNEHGEVVGLLGLGFDITERKRAEMELRRALEREQELGRMKSSFTSLVSHEFRTPLGVIASSAEILRDYFDRLEPAERLDHLETITKHTRRMGALMEEVLLLSRFDAGKTEFQAAALDLGGFSRRVADEVLSATHRRCPVQVLLGNDLPIAHADERLLRHALTNLLVNACKYSEPGSAVEFVVRQSGNHAVFEVRDRGIGIPEGDRAWLFHAFQRGSNVGNRPGTGLGLVIVKRCVDLHQGTIEVESAPGVGTLMRVQVPVFPETPQPLPGIIASPHS